MCYSVTPLSLRALHKQAGKPHTTTCYCVHQLKRGAHIGTCGIMVKLYDCTLSKVIIEVPGEGITVAVKGGA